MIGARIGVVLMAAWLGLAMLGCGGGDEDGAAPDAAQVAFEGQVEKRLVGEWKTVGKRSKYVFSEDGRYTLDAKVNTPSGAMDTHSTGEWRVKGDRFLTKDQSGNVASFRWTLEGSKLKLALTGSLKNETVMIRQ